MTSRHIRAVVRVLVCACLPVALLASQAQKPLVNDDVVKMVKSGLPESTIVAAMQASDANFDVSPAALISLHEAGVSPKVMDAMIAVMQKKAQAHPAAPAAGPPRGDGSPAIPGQPTVVLATADTTQPIAIERTKLAQTQTKPTSMAALSTDRAVNQAVRTGVADAMVRNPGAGGAAVGIVGGMFSGGGQTKKNVTYVWVLANATSQTAVNDTPVFQLTMGKMAGVQADDYAPVIVKLTPTSNGARLVGATEGKDGATSGSTLDWPVYSSFTEDRVPVQAQKLSPGVWQITPAAPLAPGEYGLVLRPVSKSKKFSGGDVARNQGDGLIFNAAWSFVVK